MPRTQPSRTVLFAALLALAFSFLGAPPANAGAGIDSEYRALGGSSGWLGEPTSSERCGLRDRGCYRQYQGGTIHWSPSTGGRAQRGGILQRWRAEGSEHGTLGYPKTRETCSGNSCVVQYQRGTIRWAKGKGSTVGRDIDRASSASVIVNKKRPLNPRAYAPGPLRNVGGGVQLRSDAATAYQRMSQAAANQGVPLVPVSGYRSYATQNSLYWNYVNMYGQATADTLSARPGYSEHQTGLAVDVGAPGGVCGLQSCFGNTPQGKWVAANAHRYGFVVRYPNGYTGTHGYAYEPWHLRYVGTATSTSLKSNGYSTLEGYLGLPNAPRY